MSGGVGSEVVAWALNTQGVHFSALIVEHTAGTNRAEVAHAREWCMKRGVHFEVMREDISYFIDNDIPRYVSEGYQAVELSRYFHLRLMEMVESLDGYAVLGRGELGLLDDGSSASISVWGDLGVSQHWQERHETAHEANFYFRTPEIIRSYLREPLIDFLLSHPEMLVHYRVAITMRRILYQINWPEMHVPPRSTELESYKSKTADKLFLDEGRIATVSIEDMIAMLSPLKG